MNQHGKLDNLLFATSDTGRSVVAGDGSAVNSEPTVTSLADTLSTIHRNICLLNYHYNQK